MSRIKIKISPKKKEEKKEQKIPAKIDEQSNPSSLSISKENSLLRSRREKRIATRSIEKLRKKRRKILMITSAFLLLLFAGGSFIFFGGNKVSTETVEKNAKESLVFGLDTSRFNIKQRIIRENIAVEDFLRSKNVQSKTATVLSLEAEKVLKLKQLKKGQFSSLFYNKKSEGASPDYVVCELDNKDYITFGSFNRKLSRL